MGQKVAQRGARASDRRAGNEGSHARLRCDETVAPERQKQGGGGEWLGERGEVPHGLERRLPRHRLEDATSIVEHDRGRAREDAGRDPLAEERLQAGADRHPTRFCFRAR